MHLRQCGEMVQKWVHVIVVEQSESECVRRMQDELVEAEVKVEMKVVVVFAMGVVEAE